nr:hypothetical protein OHB51_21145 [Micromonospora sp. NBC_00855]
MRKEFVRAIQLTLATGALILAPVTAASAAPAAEASVAQSAGAGDISIMANQCNLPTSAQPNSRFLRSYTAGQCNICKDDAKWLNANEDEFYYCTYNPSNNKVDQHYRPR